MNKLKGHIFKGIGVAIDYLLSGVIFVTAILVNIFSSIKDAIMVLFSLSGCLILVFFLVPGFVFSRYSLALLLILIFPFLGTVVVSYLKYVQYMVTEYFYEKADFYLLGKKATYETMGDYGRRYERMREQERIREEEARRRAQEEAARKQWEEFARAFGEGFTWDFGPGWQQGHYRQGEYQGQYEGHGTGYGPGTGAGGFRERYEAACGVLGVTPPSDKYEIKLTYRKMAKKYHPDINKSPDATEQFQKINDAYEFLSDEAIDRYRKLN